MALIVKDATGAAQTLNSVQDGSSVHTMRQLMDTKAVVSVTPTITASSYTANYVVGGLLTFASAVRLSAGAGVINSVVITDKANQHVQLDLWLFEGDPSSGSTLADHGAFTISSAGLIKSLGFVSVTSYCQPGTGGCVGLATPDLRVKAASGTSLYGVLLTRGTPTFASTSDITVRLVVSQD